ncbi:hypothetical protein FISHEDRAFT_42934 [Fistulina hepatica ATCC 64428]|uniref:Terpenoid synthase n=1 Tax=Fistulina hepatica ATCC 64428 TaxID=1128425 RepID=A0A0D7ACR2_9AGAR|nr:hypothetical protein FISHEDRAFT_42934 [Fistulina hepatica ATCC 64428]
MLCLQRSRRYAATIRINWHPLASTRRCISSNTVSDSFAHCKGLVQKHDYESFLVSHFFPEPLQDTFFALKAFNVDLALVQDTVSNPTIGQMRMQFWRDIVKSLHSENIADIPHHPVALALWEASKQFHLPAYYLRKIVDARDAELLTPVHMTVDSLTQHAEATASSMHYLLLSALGLSSSEALSHAASHLGVAQTIAILLRALPFHAKHGRMVIPAEITAKHRVQQEDVFRNGPRARGIDDAVFEFATVANEHLLTARSMFEGGKVSPAVASPVFLAGVPVARYLERLEKANFDAFDPKLQVKDWILPWRVWSGYYRRSF